MDTGEGFASSSPQSCSVSPHLLDWIGLLSQLGKVMVVMLLNGNLARGP